MNLDTFLKSQTFRTGVFVLLVLFILMFIFKLGVLHGYKKAIFHHAYGVNKHRSVENMYFRHRTSAFKKEMFGNYSEKINLIRVKALSGLTKEEEKFNDELIVE